MIMMKKALIYFLFPLLLPLYYSCKNDPSVEEIEYNNLPPFDEIILKGVFHVYLRQDTLFSIKIKGNKDFIDGVRFISDSGKLTFYNDSRWMWLRPENNDVELYITADQPKKISAFETCLIETVNPVITHEFGLELGYKYNEANLELNCHTFYYWNDFPCGGKLTLTGNTKELKLWNFALMAVDASGLTTDYALIDNYSQGDCRAFVRDVLEYSIHGEGNIYLYGNPDSIVENGISDSGRLIRMEGK